MNKDTLTQFFPIFALLAMIIVKIFVFCMVAVAMIVFFLIPGTEAQTAKIVQVTPLEPAVLNFPTGTLSPQDAAIANSEWSGALAIKTAEPVSSTPFVVPTIMPTSIPVQNPAPISVAAQPAVAKKVTISSPLQGFEITNLPELISQDFKIPPPGEDSGHHGVDFAFWSRGNKPILGNPILAVFPGKIAMSDALEKPPYGFALLIETPLETLPQNIIHAIKIPTQPIGTTINNKLNCPDLSKDTWNTTSKSLYTLYGHMVSAPGFKTGEAIQAGQNIGFVGNSGYSTAPHLHLEMRIGPSGASFTNMGHYDPNTTEEDRHNYCNWRVSGVFQMFDPMELLKPGLVTQ
jgi:murein DD-endopeptidase MepM/ murein hydrolase activator NlpD